MVLDTKINTGLREIKPELHKNCDPKTKMSFIDLNDTAITSPGPNNIGSSSLLKAYETGATALDAMAVMLPTRTLTKRTPKKSELVAVALSFSVGELISLGYLGNQIDTKSLDFEGSDKAEIIEVFVSEKFRDPSYQFAAKLIRLMANEIWKLDPNQRVFATAYNAHSERTATLKRAGLIPEGLFTVIPSRIINDRKNIVFEVQQTRSY